MSPRLGCSPDCFVLQQLEQPPNFGKAGGVQSAENQNLVHEGSDAAGGLGLIEEQTGAVDPSRKVWAKQADDQILKPTACKLK